MKIRSLLLGSIAAAGLASGAQAADLGVLTSLDVCDSLGLSGLTISSDTNCLQITGGISYEFNWGDYKTAQNIVATPGGTFDIPDNGGGNDWESKVEAWIKFVATADSDFGPAKAVIKIKDEQFTKTYNGVQSKDDDDTGGAVFDEAYVSIGDSTVIMAGKKGSIINKGDDEPFNFLGLFNSEKVDVGVGYNDGLTDTAAASSKIKDGGHVIQIVSDLGNGISVGAGLEALNFQGATTLTNPSAQAGTAVGVISYAGENLTGHVTLMAGGILDGNVDAYAIHAGLTGTFDNFKIRGAFAANHDVPANTNNWEGLLSAQATFDMFTLAVSGEAENMNGKQSWGGGASAGFAVSDGITINVGGRYFDSDTSISNTGEGYQIAAQLVAAVTETLKLTGEVGVYGQNSGFNPSTAAGTYDNVWYGAAEVAWAPGGDFTTSLKGQAFSNGGYKATFKAAKTFQ